jgi:adrenodoxin-NADP+ reductase
MQLGIVGCGPAGLYAARKILEKIKDVNLCIFESSIFPFGLIKTGVAPDHPELRSLCDSFMEVILDRRVHYYGNFKIDSNFCFERYFDAIIDARGTNTPNRLTALNYDAPNIADSKQVTEWILGLAKNSAIDENLINAQRILIIGQGNVALDVARFLISKPFDYAHHEIGVDALRLLLNSTPRSVAIVGRRDAFNVYSVLIIIRRLHLV